MRNVGDGDRHDPAAGIFRIAVGLRMHGVVVIARVDRVDGEEQQRTQVRAPLHRRRWKRLAFLEHAFRKVFRDAVGVDRDQRDLPLVVGIAETFNDLGARRREPAAPDEFEPDKIAVACGSNVIGKDRPALQFLAIDRLDHAAAACRLAENSEKAAFFTRQLLDWRCFMGGAAAVSRQSRDTCQDAVTDADVAIVDAALGGAQADDGPAAIVGFPLQRFCNEIAVAVAAGDFQYGDRW